MGNSRLANSAWASGWPGLEEEAERLLGRLPDLLDDAHERAESILSTPRAHPMSLLRLGRLIALAAPEIRPVFADRSAESLVPALARLALRGGPTFVKLGQLVSSTRGLAPAWIADAFAGCRDAVPPAPSEEVEGVLDRAGFTSRLKSWNRDPMASASVAQVHDATLADGTDVVIKVRRPGIVGVVAADAAWLLPALRIAERRNEKLRIANLHGAVELMVRLFAQEADLRLEAANIVELALAFEHAGQKLHIPAPVPGLVTKRALAMERIDGVGAADVENVARLGHHAEELVRLAIAGTLRTTFADGVFHGDLHLGNVLVTDHGLALVDFGIVGRLSPEQRRALIALVVAAMNDDRSAAVVALQRFGALPPDVDIAGFEAQLPPRLSREERRAMREERGREFVAERISVLVRALAAAGFQVPPELTLFVKNIVYLSDAVSRHAPDLDIGRELMDAVRSLPPDLLGA